MEATPLVIRSRTTHGQTAAAYRASWFIILEALDWFLYSTPGHSAAFKSSWRPTPELGGGAGRGGDWGGLRRGGEGGLAARLIVPCALAPAVCTTQVHPGRAGSKNAVEVGDDRGFAALGEAEGSRRARKEVKKS